MNKSLSPSALSHSPHTSLIPALCSGCIYKGTNRQQRLSQSFSLRFVRFTIFPLQPLSLCPVLSLLQRIPPLPSQKHQEEQGTQHPAGSLLGILEVEKCFTHSEVSVQISTKFTHFSFTTIAKPIPSWDCIPLAQGREMFKFPCKNLSVEGKREVSSSSSSSSPSSPPYKASALANFLCLQHSILVSPCCIQVPSHPPCLVYTKS